MSSLFSVLLFPILNNLSGLSYYKNTSKLNTNVPLGINLRNCRQKIQNGCHYYSQLASQQLTNVIYSKNINILTTLFKHFEKNLQNADYFLGRNV